MADDRLRQMYPEILWAPYFEHGKFRYWETVGRGRSKIGKDGKPRSEFYTDRHISGGSNWFRLLPPGEEPDERRNLGNDFAGEDVCGVELRDVGFGGFALLFRGVEDG